MSTPVDPASESAREILRVAARLFATRGYDATSVREIVEAAGVTKPTLYYHFGSKEGLGQALLTIPMERLIRDLRSIVEQPADPITHLMEQIEAHFAFCREEPDLARFVYTLFFSPNAPVLSEQAALYGGQMTKLLNDTTKRMAVDGIIPPDRARRCTMAVQGLITIYTANSLYQGANLEPGLARRLVNELLFGFSTSPSGLGECPGTTLRNT